MWLLRDENNEKLIYLKPNATMTVGRNKGDIVLPEDKSISRVHAHIIVETSPDFDQITENTQPLSNCTIKDGGSKYGNFLLQNDVPIRISEEGVKLNHMDRIRFGLQKNIFIVHYIPIITVTSNVTEGEKEKLKKIIDAIDGKMIYAWTPLCTHMTVVKPTISEKLSCALATLTPIVSFDYWNSVTEAFKENKELPDPADFAHTIDNQMREVGNVSVKPNPARKTLFQNRTFVHFSRKKHLLYSRMIKFAGGKSIEYGKQRPPPDVCDDNVIVVQFVESNTTQATGTGDANYAAVCEKLRECRRRTIPESEIAIALLHCSTTKYCNPRYDYAKIFASRTTENPRQDMTVLAVDTQDILGPSTSRQNQVNRPNNAALFIPETVQESVDLESQPAKKNRKDPSNDLSNNKEPNFPESVEDSPNESEIGSIKLASLNYEDHLREEFNRKTSVVEESMKRNRESEDDKPQECKKKICLGVSSISNAKERDYEDLMPDDDDAFLLDESVKDLEKMVESFKDEDKKKEKEFDRGIPNNETAAKRDRKSADDKSETTKKKSYRDLSSIDKAQKPDYKDMLDDDDEFLLDEPVHVEVKITEKKQGLRTTAKPLEIKEDLEEFDMPKRRKPTKFVDSDGDDDSQSISEKNSHRNRTVENGKTKSSEYSPTDEQENYFKRKTGRSDISPFSDFTENPPKRTKSEVANEIQIDDSPQKNSSSVKKPLMNLPSTSTNSLKTEIKEEINWIVNASIDYGSEKDTSAASDLSPTSLDRNYNTAVFIKFPNDPNARSHPLLRIKGPSDLQENRPTFGKRFRKQKIMIPVRIELDGSTYDSFAGNKKPLARSSEDEDDWDEPTTSHKVIPDIFSRAKKICRV